MAGMDRRAGMAVTYDEARVASLSEGRINALPEVIRVEQALRTVIVASPDALTGGQPPAVSSVAQG
jgi:hypothetical protein